MCFLTLYVTPRIEYEVCLRHGNSRSVYYGDSYFYISEFYYRNETPSFYTDLFGFFIPLIQFFTKVIQLE